MLPFALALPVCLHPAFADPLPLPVALEIDAVFEPWDTTHAPGCAVAVVHNGEVVYQRGYGLAELEHRVPFTPASVSNIASVSKQFTAMAVYLLERDGFLRTSDSVRRHIPELPPYTGPITLDHLLHHTSGLRDYTMLLQYAGVRLYRDHVERGAIFELIRSQERGAFGPGERFEYSNTNYLLLAHIVERVSGERFADFLEERVFRPLGMTDTRVERSVTEIIPGRARGYRPRSATTFFTSEDSFESQGDGGVFTTAEDLARWIGAFSAGRIGGADVMNKMLTPGATGDGEVIAYAGGLEIGSFRDWTLVSHGGGTGGYRARVAWLKEPDLGVALLGNVSTIRTVQQINDVLGVLADGYIQSESAEGAAATPEAPPDRGVAAGNEWIGTYRQGGGWILRFFADGARFFVELNGGAPLELVQTEPGRFMIADSPSETFVFSKTDAGPRSCDYCVDDRPQRWHGEVEPLDRARAAPYVGVYRSDELGVSYDVTLEHGRLWLRLRGFGDRRVAGPMIREKGERFTAGGADVFEFVLDEAGRATDLFVTINRMGRLRFARAPGS